MIALDSVHHGEDGHLFCLELQASACECASGGSAAASAVVLAPPLSRGSPRRERARDACPHSPGARVPATPEQLASHSHGGHGGLGDALISTSAQSDKAWCDPQSARGAGLSKATSWLQEPGWEGAAVVSPSHPGAGMLCCLSLSHSAPGETSVLPGGSPPAGTHGGFVEH